MTRLCWIIASFTIACWASSSAAQDNAALAETLFREGKALAAQGSFDQACPKLADSHRLDPGGGTVLALAHCYEAAGRLASAWAAFNEAIAFSERDERADRAAEARDRIAALEPRLARLDIRVKQPIEGLELSRNGELVPRSAWGSRIPLDQGSHAFEANAPGHVAWRTTLVVEREGQILNLEVPALQREPEPEPAPEPTPAPRPALPPPPSPDPPREPRSDGSTQRVLGYSALGLGLVGLSLGTFFGVRARARSRDADAICPDTECNDPAAVRKSQDASRDATISTVAFAIGAAGSAVGAYLVLSSESESTIHLSIAGPAGVGPHALGVFR